MGPAGDEQMDGGRGRAEVVTQVLGERFDGRFGCIICRVARRVGDALLGAGDDNGRGCGLTADRRKKGGDAIDDAKEIGIYDLQN